MDEIMTWLATWRHFFQGEFSGGQVSWATSKPRTRNLYKASAGQSHPCTKSLLGNLLKIFVLREALSFALGFNELHPPFLSIA